MECNGQQAMCYFGELAITNKENLEHTQFGKGKIRAAKIAEGLGAQGIVVSQPGELQVSKFILDHKCTRSL